MMKKSKILSHLLFPLVLVALHLSAKNDTANYSGNTGILETPNTRIMQDWSMRMFINQDKPYTYYGLALTPLPFLETNFHITQVDGISGANSDMKDKSISFKLILQEERESLPSVVFGADDIWGSGLYTSKYIALGKKIGYFDFTLGYAKGRLGGEPLTPTSGSDNTAFEFMKDFSWSGGEAFGSIAFNATPNLTLMAEYSPIDYSKERVNPFSSGSGYSLPSSKINYGAKYDFGDNSTLSLSYQRGNQLSFGYNYQFGFSQDAIFTHVPEAKFKADEETLKEYENLDEKQLSNNLSKEVAQRKLSNVQSSVNENKIWTEFDNSKYNNDLKAMGKAIATIDELAPKKYDTIYATVKQHDVAIKTVKVNRKEYDAYENGKASYDYMQNAAILTNSVEKMEKEFKNEKKDIYKTSKLAIEKFDFSIGPEFKTYLGANDKSLASKVSLAASVNYDISKGLFVKSKFIQPLYNSIDNMANDGSLVTNSKLSNGSNMIDYYKYNKTQMQSLTADYIFRAPFESMGKVEVGYLDLAFAGTDLEWYKSFLDDKIGFGLQYQYVYKRAVDDMFKIENDLSYDAKFLNIYYLLSEKYDTHLGLKVGEFFSGDKGVKVDLSRHYKDFTLGAYATFTDNDEVFNNNQNDNYIDKGVYIKIPLDTFTNNKVKGKIDYGISPWSKDVGQYSGTSMSLYPMNNSENNIKVMKKNIQKIIE